MRNSTVIRQLSLSDTKNAADLHLKTIPGISSLLGKSYLNKFYQMLVKNKKHMSFAIYVDNYLRGLVTATEDILETSQELHRFFNLNSYLTLFLKIINLQISPLAIYSRVMFEKYQKKSYKKPYLSIVTLCVDPKYQRHGFGSKLIKSVLAEAKKRDKNIIYVDARADNKKANKFYLKLGFKKQRKIFGNAIFYKRP